MNAREIMTPNPVCCLPSTGLAEIARLMATHDCGAIPVVDDSGSRLPLGIITDRDIVLRAVAVDREPRRLTARDCMSGPCVIVTEDMSLDDCCDAMEANQIRRLVVVDTENRVLGVIAQADIAKAASAAKTAEVVREISLSQDALHATF